MKKIISLFFIILLMISNFAIFAFGYNNEYTDKIPSNYEIINALKFSTFIGGSLNDGMFYTGINIIQDIQGNFIIAGTTESLDFPITDNALYKENSGNSDIIVVKIDEELNDIICSTYIGGSNNEEARAIIIDQDGNIFICGITESSDFPVTANCYQYEYKGGTEAPYGSGDVFIVKFNKDLDSLLSSTYLGGAGHESCSSIGINSDGDVIISGLTSSSDFPVSDDAYDTTYNPGGYFKDDVFVTTMNNDLTEILSSTYIGGSQDDFSEALMIDSFDNIFISGWTRSSNYPTSPGSFDTSFGGVYDGFITKLNKDLTDIISSTYLGGTQWDFCYGLSLDNNEKVYVTGHTASLNFPTTPNVYCRNYQGNGGANIGDDVFISKLSNNLSNLIYSTYLGGDNWESGFNIQISSNDMIYLTGTTSSNDFPTLNSFSDSYGGGETHYGDIFLSCLNSDFSMLTASTYLGGNINENSGQFIISNDNDIILSGSSSSSDFPIIDNCYDSSHNGNSDIIITIFNQGLSNNNIPIKPSKPTGEVTGKTDETYTYSSGTNDPDGDEIWFNWDFGDGTFSGWIGPYNNGENCEINHSWNEDGEYSIKVKARDVYGDESEWSDPLIISVPLRDMMKDSLSTNDLSWIKHRITSEFGSASSLIICDINDDKNIDFLGTSWDLKQICLWSNNGNKPYDWETQVIDFDFNGSAYVNINDIDNDGDIDIVGAAWYDGEISWWENNGQFPIHWSKNIIKSGFGEAHEVYSCDFDNDGDIDIFAASAELNEITWWENIGGSTIEWQEQKIGDCYGARSVYVDDIDGDGDNDVLGADFDRDNICWWRNDGGYPIIWSKFYIDSDFNGAHHVIAFDVDKDGDKDIIGASAIGNEISIWMNSGDDTPEWVEFIVDDNFRGALRVSVADVDDDQDYDIIGTSVGSNKISWWRNENKNFSNWTRKTVDLMCVGAWPLDVQDIDGDGDIDILGGGVDSISWYENDLYCDSNLECEGNLNLVDIIPGSTINSSFTVENIGKEDSSLNWAISDYPDWGIWSFDPINGNNLYPIDGKIIVNVSVIVPDQKNTDFSGTIRLKNVDASGDYDEISVSLSTSFHNKNIKFENLFYFYEIFLKIIGFNR